MMAGSSRWQSAVIGGNGAWRARMRTMNLKSNRTCLYRRSDRGPVLNFTLPHNTISPCLTSKHNFTLPHKQTWFHLASQSNTISPCLTNKHNFTLPHNTISPCLTSKHNFTLPHKQTWFHLASQSNTISPCLTSKHNFTLPHNTISPCLTSKHNFTLPHKQTHAPCLSSKHNITLSNKQTQFHFITTNLIKQSVPPEQADNARRKLLLLVSSVYHRKGKLWQFKSLSLSCKQCYLVS